MRSVNGDAEKEFATTVSVGFGPIRKDQPQNEAFDRPTYRRRNLIERVVGWDQEYRALGTRYDELAVNDVALWLLALIKKLLRQYAQRLQTGLSERA